MNSLILTISVLCFAVFFSCKNERSVYTLIKKPESSFILEADSFADFPDMYPLWSEKDSLLMWINRDAKSISYYRYADGRFSFVKEIFLQVSESVSGTMPDVYRLPSGEIVAHLNTTVDYGLRLCLFDSNGKFLRKIEIEKQLQKLGNLKYGKDIVVPAVKIESGYTHRFAYSDDKLYAYFHNGFNRLQKKQPLIGCIDLRNGDRLSWLPVDYPPEWFYTSDPVLMTNVGFYKIHNLPAGDDSLIISYDHQPKIDVYSLRQKKLIGTAVPRTKLNIFPDDTVNMKSHPTDGNLSHAISGYYSYLYFDKYRNLFYRMISGPAPYDPKNPKVLPDYDKQKSYVQILNRKMELIGETEQKLGKVFCSPAGIHSLDFEATQKANIGNKGKQKFIFNTYTLKEQ